MIMGESIKNNPLVSVIVPVYNVEKYIDKCIESIQKQTLGNIEIILVDDGSTDLSGKKCDAYLTDSRIKVIHKKNGGLSEARNFGIRAATAPYVGFVDSDDYIAADMYEVLYKRITEENADIAFCGMYDCYANRTKPSYEKTEGKFVTDAEEAIKLVMHGKMASVTAVNKLYKKELLDENCFLVGKTSEDAHFIIPFLTKIKKAAFDMTPEYYYVHRGGTITTKPFIEKDLSICEAYLNNRKIIEEKYPSLTELADFRVYWSWFYVLDKMLRIKTRDDSVWKKKIISCIRKNYRKIMKNPFVGKGRKIASTGLMLNEKFYLVCLKLYTKRNKQLIGQE